MPFGMNLPLGQLMRKLAEQRKQRDESVNNSRTRAQGIAPKHPLKKNGRCG